MSDRTTFKSHPDEVDALVLESAGAAEAACREEFREAYRVHFAAPCEHTLVAVMEVYRRWGARFTDRRVQRLKEAASLDVQAELEISGGTG